MQAMERITSRQNAVVKRFRDLARDSRGAAAAIAPARRPDDRLSEILLDGEHLVQEALACNIAVDVAAFLDRQIADERSPLAGLALDVRQRGGRPLLVSDQVLAAISPVQHPSGVVAIARTRAADARGVIGMLRTAGRRVPIALVLAGLQDPGNVGAAIRSAAAFGAGGVVAIDGSANPFGWKALRGAMGGTFRLPVASSGTLQDIVSAARDQRVRILAAVPRGGTLLSRLDLKEPTALILGAEGTGVSEPTLAAAQATVTIPMQPPIESLNVAVAAALILYEALRQKDIG